MAKLVAKLMFVLCLWNLAVSSAPAFSMTFVADGIKQAASSNAPCVETDEVATSEHVDDCDCDPNNCENEHCRFHQCHFGHCSFLVRGTSVAILKPAPDLVFPIYQWIIQPVSLSGPIRPPNS